MCIIFIVVVYSVNAKNICGNGEFLAVIFFALWLIWVRKKNVVEEQMFFENTNLDFLDKRYPFKDIKKIYANKISRPGK